MNRALFLLLATLVYAGFAALCLSMEKHSLDLRGHASADPRRRRAWRWLGWACLALALLAAALAEGWALGPVIWLGVLTAAGLPLVLGLLPYRPRWLAATGWTLAALTVLAAALASLA